MCIRDRFDDGFSFYSGGVSILVYNQNGALKMCIRDSGEGENVIGQITDDGCITFGEEKISLNELLSLIHI